MGDQYQINTAPLVNVRITSNLNSFTAEKRYDRGLTIAEFKGRLELVTGASANSMSLQVFDDNDQLLCSITDDTALLGSYPIEENYRIHVTDNGKKVGEFEDVSNVDKYELCEEEYNSRNASKIFLAEQNEQKIRKLGQEDCPTYCYLSSVIRVKNSVRAFLVKNRLGKYNEEEQQRLKEQKQELETAEVEKASTISVGNRCEVKVQGEPTRRGEVMYIGNVHFKPGIWVGVKYDEPLGKNDGSIGGKRYFEAPMKYGGFTRPTCVEVGDFPILDYEDDEM